MKHGLINILRILFTWVFGRLSYIAAALQEEDREYDTPERGEKWGLLGD